MNTRPGGLFTRAFLHCQHSCIMNTRLRLTLISGACVALMTGAPVHAAGVSKSATALTAREQALMERMAQLSAEMDALKAEVQSLKQAQMASATAVAPTPAEPLKSTSVAPDVAVDNEPEATPSAQAATVLTGYGEINYNRYRYRTADASSGQMVSQDQADLRRFVFGIQHRFDARTKLVTEVEVEHSVASASDAGEVAVEQAYVERQLNDQWSARMGLFVMPAGLLNENHEPTAYYGVERNFVETAIIPSTWREGGVQLVGVLDNGLTVQGGVSTGFNLSEWTANDAGFAAEAKASPLGASHQELAQAAAHDLAVFGAVNWRGIPGLLLGGSYFAGNAGQGQATTAGNGLRVTLWDLHARYSIADWDLSALYARGTIGGTSSFNASGSTVCTGANCAPVPRLFDGGYIQAAYKVGAWGDLSLSPFVRLERFNTAKAFADSGAGLTQEPASTEQVWTLGANLNVGQGVVLKADVQRFKENKQRDRLDLGLGWSF